jgi:chromosome segregation ATPase
MPEINPSPRTSPAAADELPEVCLEVGHGTARSTVYPVADAGFLIGTVPGCDLRVPGNDWPAVLCLVARRPGGASFRKLSPTQPVFVNGKPAASSILTHGDRLKVGPVEMVVQVQASAYAPSPLALLPLRGRREQDGPPLSPGGGERPGVKGGSDRYIEDARQKLQQQIQQLREQIVTFEKDKQHFTEQSARQSRELAKRVEEIERLKQESATEHAAALAGLDERERALKAREDEVAAQKQELATMRQELADIRTQLYERYRERRDRLAGLQESITRAARKAQERKQTLDAEVRDWENRRREESDRNAELKGQADDVAEARKLFDDERRLHESRVAEMHAEVKRRLDEARQGEQQATADRAALEQDQARLKEDLLRLDRLRAELDEREKRVEAHNADLDQRWEQLRTDTREMESQVIQLDEWHTKLTTVGEKLAKQKTEQEQVSQQLAQRAAALEGQQAALAALRTRLERMREEVREQERLLAEQRTRQETAEAALKQKHDDVQKQRAEVDGDKLLAEQERRMLADRAAVLDNAVAQLRQAQDRLTADEQRVREQAQTLDAAAAQQTEATSLLQARITQYDELHKRLEAERDNLRERTQMLAQAEQARETLQEQLRRRNEELTARQKALAEQVARYEADAAELKKQRDSLDEVQQKHRDELAGERLAVEQRGEEIARQEANLAERLKALEQERADLDQGKRALADQSQEFVEQRARLDIDRRIVEEAAARARADLDTARRDALALQQQLPELELRAGTALERLTHAREQLREQLDEVHTYAGQCREELEAMRAGIQAEAERVRQQEQALRRGQDEQRLAVAAFRQQLIDWQGQLDDMKRLMAHDESRLEQRQAQVAEQARQLGADTARLAQQADQLQEKEREVAVKRGEMDRHLSEMREWYRRKLRELAGISDPDAEDAKPPSDDGPRRDILSLTGDVDPIDQKLGELMTTLDLIEPDTLTALLVEARRQRRSLRQVLLASGAVTLYQMALIEANNLDGLMLGPVRVVDRLCVRPRETVYRVFDPRRGGEAVLRHLAEGEAADAIRPDEFRQRFSQARLSHPNLAATLEVLDVAGRPAALQEWLTGLPSPEWPALAAVPGVWYRLVLQATQALHAAHEAGLSHGHLQPEHLVLTGDGTLKVCGFGEPPWLVTTAFVDQAATDLAALGRIANDWCEVARKKAARGKPLPDRLQASLDRLSAEGDERINTAAALLEELEKAAPVVPANPEAWDRLLRHVKENAGPLATLRQSA